MTFTAVRGSGDGDWRRDTSFETPLMRFLDDLFPNMDERERFVKICRQFEANNLKDVAITLKEVAFIKLFCDVYFLAKVRPKAIEAKRLEDERSNKK